METIINYLLAVDGARDRAFDVRIGDRGFYIWERHGVIRVSFAEGGSVRRFHDPMDALAYIHGIVKEDAHSGRSVE